MIISSGHGTHCYWRLAEACERLDLWRELQLDVIACVGSDPTIHNPERIMRLPGFFNCKEEPHVLAEIIDADPNLRYDFNHVRALVPRVQEQEHRRREEDRRQREEADARSAYRQHASASRNGKASVIDAFNDAHDVALMLERHGYVKGRQGRYIRPGGETESVSVRDGTACHWSSDDPLFNSRPPAGSCGVSDAFSVFCHFEHAGDVHGALKAAAAAMGMSSADQGGAGGKSIATASAAEADAGAPAPDDDFGPVLVCLADVTPREVEWLWERRIALGKPTLVAGDPGLGKSMVTIDFAARVTSGSPWPDGIMPPLGDAILITAEDELDDTIRPRLDAAGADVSRVVALQAVAYRNEKGSGPSARSRWPISRTSPTRFASCRGASWSSSTR